MSEVELPKLRPGAVCRICGKPVTERDNREYVKSKKLMLWVHTACVKGGKKK